MTVRFASEAQQHISDIHRYIHLRNPAAAHAVTARIIVLAVFHGAHDR